MLLTQGARDRLGHEPDLREFNFGDWDGRHWADVAEDRSTTEPRLLGKARRCGRPQWRELEHGRGPRPPCGGPLNAAQQHHRRGAFRHHPHPGATRH